MKRGKYIRTEGIRLTSYEEIKEIDTNEGYKYLGIYLRQTE